MACGMEIPEPCAEPCCVFCDLATDAEVWPLSRLAPRCTICLWRSVVLDRYRETCSDDEVVDCKYNVLPQLMEMQQALERARHCDPGPLWKSILNTLVLKGCTVEFDPATNKAWCRFPVTQMLEEYVFLEDLERSSAASHTMWRATPLRKLSNPCPDVPYSKGIFRDKCLRYGACTHNGNNEMNIYSYFPGQCVYEQFDEDNPWCILKIACIPGHSAGRFCGPTGEPCFTARIEELWTEYAQTPVFCRID